VVVIREPELNRIRHRHAVVKVPGFLAGASVFMAWSFLQGVRLRFQFCRGGVQNLSGIFLYFTFTRYAPTNRVGTPTKRVGTSDFLGA